MNSNYGWGEYSDLPSDKINGEMIFVREELVKEFYHGKKENIIEHIIFNNIILRFGNLKIFTDIGNKSSCSFILKISGIWETEEKYGLTYKFIKIN